MPRALDQFLHVHVRAAESLLRFRSRRPKHRNQLVRVAHDAHPAPAAALGRFNHDRIADFRRDPLRRILIRHNSRAARNDRQSRRAHGLARLVFFAHQPDRIRRRPDKRNVRGFAYLGKVRILRKESVARMDGVDVRDFRRADHLRNIQIAFAAARRPDADRFIRKAHVQRVAVRLRIHRDRLHAEFPASRQNTQSDFAAIGD